MAHVWISYRLHEIENTTIYNDQARMCVCMYVSVHMSALPLPNNWSYSSCFQRKTSVNGPSVGIPPLPSTWWLLAGLLPAPWPALCGWAKESASKALSSSNDSRPITVNMLCDANGSSDGYLLINVWWRSQVYLCIHSQQNTRLSEVICESL